MYSKKSICILTLALSFTLLGCGLKIGEKNKSNQEAAKVKSAQCLNQSIDELKLFLKGSASDEQVSQSILCLQNVFIAFKENIRGQDKNVYTAQEIADFVEVNFFTDGTHIEPEFLFEVMKLKVVLFGGSQTLIAKPEIDQIVSLMSRLKPQLVAINPHMKIISMQWKPEPAGSLRLLNEQRFQLAKEQFSQFVIQVLNEFKEGGRPYKIDDILNLVVEASKFAKTSEQTIDTIKKSSVFFKRFKRHLIGGSSSIRGDDWEKLGMTLSEAYFQALRYQYFLDPLDESQVEEKWSFYQKIALDISALVEKLLTAKETQALTNEEILDLIEPLSEILPQIKVNADLLNGLGDLKVMLLGKSKLGSGGWSRDDFQKLYVRIPTLFDKLSVLSIEIDAITNSKKASISYPSFLAKEVRIQSAVDGLSQLIVSDYDVKSLQTFLESLAATLLKGYISLPADLTPMFNVALAAQTALTGEKDSLLNPVSLRLLLTVGVRGYLNYIEYNLFLAPYQSKNALFNHNLIRLWPKIKSTLSFALTQKSSHVITTDELTNLIMVLQQEKFLNTKLRPESIKEALNSLWSHILNAPEIRLRGQTQPGLNALVLAQTSDELLIYLQNQKNIAEIFGTSNSVSQADLIDQLKQRQQGSIDFSENTGLNELLLFLNPIAPLNFDANGFLHILSPEVGQYHYEDLANSNLSRAISRLAIRGYAKDLTRVNTLGGVQLDEIEVAYAQLKPAAVDLEMLEESNTTFISSRFRESNLFLTTSNGDTISDFKELHQLMIHILSGMSRAAVVKEEIVARCLPGTWASEVKASTTVNEDCLLQAYLVEPTAFLGMPNFERMKNQYTPAQLKEHYMSLLKAAGHVPNAEKLVRFADADLFPHVVQYIEMIFATHDLNKDGVLDKAEATKAFPVFKNLLKELVSSYKQIKEEDLRGVFIYILKNGRPPNTKNLGELLKFLVFIRDTNEKGWDIQSTRVDLGRIFNYIADATQPVTAIVPVVVTENATVKTAE